MSDGRPSTDLFEVFGAIRSRLKIVAKKKAAELPVLGPCVRADDLGKRFCLSRFERDVLLLAAFAELEHDAPDLMGAAQGDERLQAPSVALALSVLDDASWGALSPDGPLRRFELIRLRGDGPTVARAIEIAGRVLLFLLGQETIDETLISVSQRLDSEIPLAPSRESVAKRISERLEAGRGSGSQAVLQLCGASRPEMIQIAARAAARRGCSAFLMNAGVLAVSPLEQVRVARLWEREMKLAENLLVIDATEASVGNETRQVVSLIENLTGAVIVVTAEPLSFPRRTALRIDVPRSPAREQVQLWRSALGSVATEMNGSVEKLASHFTLTPAVVTTIGTKLERALAADSESDLEKIAWNEARSQARPKLGNLAQRIEGNVGWTDIILPGPQMETLKTIEAQVRNRIKVYEEWGFADRSRRGLGISALFTGQSGVGKTLAAECLGAALKLDVFRIDLSSVVSKWIGETEKNLRLIFDAADDGCAVLLFDEADALFGKRSDIKDSHDRYGNIEVSYLLQRLEAYRGLAILTTNLKENVDDAFLRRVRFVVDFPFPDRTQRKEIWELMFREKDSTAVLEYELLGQISLPGGNIRNIAVNAAFLAAEAGDRIGMDHVLAATRAECEKIGRPLTSEELRGWPG